MRKYAVVFHMETISALACNEEIGEYARVDLEDTEHYYPIVMFANKSEAKEALKNFCYNNGTDYSKTGRVYKHHEIVTEEVLKLYLAEDKLSRVA
jgi:hypothetical protein